MERKEVSPDVNAKSHTSQQTGSHSRSCTWHLNKHIPHIQQKRLIKPARWDSRDQELLCFHYPKWGVTVTANGETFSEYYAKDDASFTLDANKRERGIISEMLAPFFIVCDAIAPHLFKVRIAFVGLVKTCEQN